MFRLGHYSCQSTTNEIAFMVMGHCQEKCSMINTNFLGENDKFFKGHTKRAGLQRSLPEGLRCICCQNAWNILVKELVFSIFSNMTGLMHRAFQKSELLHKWVRLQISDHVGVVTFLERKSVDDLWQLKICNYVYSI